MRYISLCLLAFLTHFATATEVLTISDSIVDHILFVDEEFISTIPGKKGGSELVDDNLFNKIIRESNAKALLYPGASAVNMLKGLSQLGHDCALITTIGEDDAGKFFLASLVDQGIDLTLQTSSTPTGKSACLVTPDGERTMRTFLGASKENNKLHLKEEDFQGITHFHLEGYQLKHRGLVSNSLLLAKKNNATVSLDLSSFEVVRAHKEFIWELLHNGSIDLLFANQQEAEVLTGLPAREASSVIAKHAAISVITLGEKGCICQKGDVQWQCPACLVDVVDTIGAGDLFVSGFLHGYLTQQPVPACARTGTILASHVVQVLGAEIPSDHWEEIKSALCQK